MLYKILALLICNVPWVRKTILERAYLTPYWHLDGYMLRYWVTPRLLLTTDEHGNLIPYSWLPKILKVRLHVILRGDIGEHPHNHPCDNTTILLEGTYIEDTYSDAGEVTSRLVKEGDVVDRGAKQYHRLTLNGDNGALSLWFMGAKTNDWGFLVNGVHVPCKRYFSPL